MEVWNPAHPHHAVWREYTQSLLDGKPKMVECRDSVDPIWRITPDPAWYPENEYHIARPMLTLSYEVPMPVTEPLEHGCSYWLAFIDSTNPCNPVSTSCEHDRRWLRAGLIYLTEADAQAAIDAHRAAMTAALESAK